jgi:hypothetical protein
MKLNDRIILEYKEAACENVVWVYPAKVRA